jgi:lysophospholipase L1-like esterase
MELTGKKINFLGDSITEGHIVTAPERMFVEVITKNCQLGAGRNYGISGTRIARQRTPSCDLSFDQHFSSRICRMDPDADIVVVFGGTNDYGHGDAPLGADDDRTADTFYGACHELFTLLPRQFPHAKIVVLTPLHRLNEDTPVNAVGTVLEEYVTILRKTVSQYGFPLLDLFETSAIQAHIPELAEKYTADGLHPNDLGHAVLAEEIAAFLKSL